MGHSTMKKWVNSARKSTTMSLDFRKMVVEDLPAVFEVRFSTIENAITEEELEEHYGITRESLAAAIQTPDTAGWLCEDGDTVVGFSMGDRSNGEVTVVAVRPEQEGRGVGKGVLTRVRDWLFEAGHERIWLYTTHEPALRAYGFYLHLGWEATGELHDDEGVMVLKRR